MSNYNDDNDDDLDPIVMMPQPGLVRVYNSAGTFQGAYKLFSSNRMYVAGGAATNEQGLFTAADNAIPGSWDSTANSGRWASRPCAIGSA